MASNPINNNFTSVKMPWAKLINPTKSKKQTIDQEYVRTTFEHDAMRIVSSASFRKLQDKTQAIPLSDNDMVHNRLTHTIEVAAVGKKLARMVADYVWDNHIEITDKNAIASIFKCDPTNQSLTKEVFINNVADIVEAACLIHDLGNPPFGHQGEGALSETYDDLANLPEYGETLVRLAKAQPDIFKIEGNAQTLRSIANNKSIDLTYATLAVSIKYPCVYHQGNSIYKKFNVYQSEQELFNKIMINCGIVLLQNHEYARHPLVYLVEAADDICYSLFDFEDFVHLGFVSEEVYCGTLINIILSDQSSVIATKTHGGNLSEKRIHYKQDLYANNQLSFIDIVSKLRSEAIFQMMLNAFDVFQQKYEYIISGIYTIENQLLSNKGKIHGLLDIYATLTQDEQDVDAIDHANQALKKYSVNYGYNNIAVLKNSLGGYEVMSGLLKTYIAALHNLNKLKSQMVLFTIPEMYLSDKLRVVLSKRDAISWVDVLSDEQQIEQIQWLNDYLTGLTDNAALRLFRHMKGHEQITIT